MGWWVKRARLAFSPDRRLGRSLVLSKDMMASISKVRDQASRRKISAYLERNAEDQLKHLDADCQQRGKNNDDLEYRQCGLLSIETDWLI